MSKTISDADLRSQLKNYGVNVGPITGTTRSIYLQKLEKMKKSTTPSATIPPVRKPSPKPTVRTPLLVQENGTSKKEDIFYDADKNEPPSRWPTKRSFGSTTVNDTSSNRQDADFETTISSRRPVGNPILNGTSTSHQSTDFSLPAVSRRSVGNTTVDSATSNRQNTDFASAAASRRSLGTYQPSSAFTSSQRKDTISDERWNSFRDTTFKRLEETASSFGLLDRSKREILQPPRTVSATPKYGSIQNDALSNSNAEWYRSRQQDGGTSWTGWAPDATWTTETRANKRRWWNLSAKLDANTSRLLLYTFSGFLLLLALLYAIIMNKSKVHFFGVMVLGALVDTGYFVYNHMILPALIALTVVCLVVGAIWYKKYKWHTAAEEQQQIFDMVEKILALLKKHYEECLVDNNRQPYLAVPHVRDMLIPPSRRKQLLPIWDKAVQYLNENESRVRTENQIISGEEFMVWRWLQISGTSPADEKLWQGHAFPEEQAVLNAPSVPYFECLKLRGLFDPDLEEEDDWPEHIQDAILEKLGQAIRVMHVAIDTESKEGCVYMKFGSKEEAGAAYKVLHGSWFNGRLVTVKYLRPERYHERFPEAQRCSFPLHVKKARHSLLG